MSSILGHSLAGAAVSLAIVPRSRGSTLAAALCVMAAVLPDLDYFAIWVFDVVFRPRFSHSLSFCVVAAMALWFVGRRIVPEANAYRLLPALLLASVSHPVLDLFVGAHPVPLLWPASSPDVALPFGILPSAGRLQVDNIYLWRNLLIEIGLFGPVLIFVAAARLRWPRAGLIVTAAVSLPIFLGCLVWSMQLAR